MKLFIKAFLVVLTLFAVSYVWAQHSSNKTTNNNCPSLAVTITNNSASTLALQNGGFVANTYPASMLSSGQQTQFALCMLQGQPNIVTYKAGTALYQFIITGDGNCTQFTSSTNLIKRLQCSISWSQKVKWEICNGTKC